VITTDIELELGTPKQQLNRKQFLGAWRNSREFFSNVLFSPWYRTIGKLLAEINAATHRFYTDRSIGSIPVPITCYSISSPFGLGSDSEPVEINLFDNSVFLADSMQFHLEYLLRQGFEGVYYLMPTFRGETPDTRHLNQFFHSEMEMRGNLEDVMCMVENYIRYCVDAIYRKFAEDINYLGGGLAHVEDFLNSSSRIPRISFEETKEIVPRKAPFYKFADQQEISLTAEGEAVLLAYFKQPVWLTHLLARSVPFYQAQTPDGHHAYCADLLMGIGEIVGCGQRHQTREETLSSLITHQVDPNAYAWYLRMKEEMPLLTSGFGMGVERLILWLLNHNDIRDIPLFNRLKGNEYAP